MDDGFKAPGESPTTARFRRQEEIHQKASAALSVEVSIIVMSGHWISLWLSFLAIVISLVKVVLNLVASLRKSPFCY